MVVAGIGGLGVTEVGLTSLLESLELLELLELLEDDEAVVGRAVSGVPVVRDPTVGEGMDGAAGEGLGV